MVIDESARRIVCLRDTGVRWEGAFKNFIKLFTSGLRGARLSNHIRHA